MSYTLSTDENNMSFTNILLFLLQICMNCFKQIWIQHIETYKIELRLSQSIIEYNNKLITSVHVQHTCMDRMVAGLTVTL
jgi:hypothetical protein